MVRASNTSPALTLRFEADGAAALDRIQGVFRTQLGLIDPNLSFNRQHEQPQPPSGQHLHDTDGALPYIRKFHGCTIVVKYGGAAMVEESLKIKFARI